MDVSCTPIHVAFQRLIEDGLLTARANRGVFIAG
jgi:DNA-binding GntR family transcriptional regulator